MPCLSVCVMKLGSMEGGISVAVAVAGAAIDAVAIDAAVVGDSSLYSTTANPPPPDAAVGVFFTPGLRRSV